MADPIPSGSTNSSTFAITIDDTSPTIAYSPFADTFSDPNISSGWNPEFSDSGFSANPAEGEIGNGTSLHVTAADGGSLSVRWNGTAIYLYGVLNHSGTISDPTTSASYSLSLDGVPTTNYASSFVTPVNYDNEILAAFENLTYGEHVVELWMHNPDSVVDGSTLQFDRAVIVGGVPPLVKTSEDVSSSLTSLSSYPPSSFASSSNLTLTTQTQPYPDDSISYRGQWSYTHDLLPGQDYAFHTSTNVGDRAHLSFSGTAITISGLTSPFSGSYNITLDDETPVTLSARSSFNASAPTLLYFRTGLDPTFMHELDVVNAGAFPEDDHGTLLVFGSVNVTTVDQNPPPAVPMSGSSSSRFPRGTIAALAIGASLAVLAIIALAIFLVRRRRRSRRRKQDLLVNPRMSKLRRLSFLTRSYHSHQDDEEKDPQEGVGGEGVVSPGVLDIRASKDFDDDDDDDDIHEIRRASGEMRDNGRSSGGRASQNSDGSFSINLPDLPARGYARSSQGSPIPQVPSSPLSPRSMKPRGPRDMQASLGGHGRDSSRGILLSEVYTAVSAGNLRIGTNFLPDPQISPLRVNFEDEPYEQALHRRDERYVSAGVISLPQSLKQALSSGHDPNLETQPNTPTTDRAAHYSFLDLDSSASASPSLRSDAQSARQSHSNSTRSSSKSRPDNGGSDQSAPSVNWASTPPNRRVSLGLSMAIAGGPTSSRPSLSPNISLQPVSLPPLPSPKEPVPSLPEDAIGPQERQIEPSDMLPSPTDSIPLTVSDIHFRHSSFSTISQPSESRRVSANRMSGSHRPPHPPLPGGIGTQTVEPPPFIVQKLLGKVPPGSGPNTPYGSPVVPGFGASGSNTGSGAGRGTRSPPSAGVSSAPLSFGSFRTRK